MTPVEALRLALAEENKAIDLYSRFSKEHSSIREELTFFINEEQKHRKLIEKKIVELTKF